MFSLKVKGKQQAKALIDYLFEKSQKFDVEPRPDCVYTISVREENIATVRRFLRDQQPEAICDNCDWQGSQYVPLEEVPLIWERLDPGSTVPAGECPECGALCYLPDED